MNGKFEWKKFWIKIENEKTPMVVYFIDFIAIAAVIGFTTFIISLFFEPLSLESIMMILILIFGDCAYIYFLLIGYYSPASPMEQQYKGGFKFSQHPLLKYGHVCSLVERIASRYSWKCASTETTRGISTYFRRRVREFIVGPYGVTFYVCEVAPVFKGYFRTSCRIFLRKVAKRDDPRGFMEFFTKHLVFEMLLDTINCNDGNIRWNAVFRFLKLTDEEPEIILMDLLDNEDVHICRKAALALMHIESPKAVEPLIRALHHEDKIVRLNAITSLRKIGDHSAKDPLHDLVLSDPDREVRDAAKEAYDFIV